MPQKILIRCDASKEIGLGHLSRCLVLAKQFQKEGAKIYFAIRKNPLAIQTLQEEDFEYFLPRTTSYNGWLQDLVDENSINIFIGDVRDNLLTKTIQTFKAKKILTVALDEPSEYAKECDICFYPPHAKIDTQKYKGKIYQGFEYVVLRDEFYKPHQKIKNQKSHILVMMGGTDAHNLSLQVVQQLLSSKIDADISLIISKNHPDYKKLSTIAPNVKLYSNIKDMAIFLTQIDFAIITFGVSAYELVAMGIFAYHICLDDDHYSASEFFERNGYAKRVKTEEIERLKEIQFSSLQTVIETNLIVKAIKNIYLS